MIALIGSSGWIALGVWLLANVLFIPIWAAIMKDRRDHGGN